MRKYSVLLVVASVFSLFVTQDSRSAEGPRYILVQALMTPSRPISLFREKIAVALKELEAKNSPAVVGLDPDMPLEFTDQLVFEVKDSAILDSFLTELREIDGIAVSDVEEILKTYAAGKSTLPLLTFQSAALLMDNFTDKTLHEKAELTGRLDAFIQNSDEIAIAHMRPELRDELSKVLAQFSHQLDRIFKGKISELDNPISRSLLTTVDRLDTDWSRLFVIRSGLAQENAGWEIMNRSLLDRSKYIQTWFKTIKNRIDVTEGYINAAPWRRGSYRPNAEIGYFDENLGYTNFESTLVGDSDHSLSLGKEGRTPLYFLGSKADGVTAAQFKAQILSFIVTSQRRVESYSKRQYEEMLQDYRKQLFEQIETQSAGSLTVDQINALVEKEIQNKESLPSDSITGHPAIAHLISGLATDFTPEFQASHFDATLYHGNIANIFLELSQFSANPAFHAHLAERITRWLEVVERSKLNSTSARLRTKIKQIKALPRVAKLRTAQAAHLICQRALSRSDD